MISDSDWTTWIRIENQLLQTLSCSRVIILASETTVIKPHLCFATFPGLFPALALAPYPFCICVSFPLPLGSLINPRLLTPEALPNCADNFHNCSSNITAELSEFYGSAPIVKGRRIGPFRFRASARLQSFIRAWHNGQLPM